MSHQYFSNDIADLEKQLQNAKNERDMSKAGLLFGAFYVAVVGGIAYAYLDSMQGKPDTLGEYALLLTPPAWFAGIFAWKCTKAFVDAGRSFANRKELKRNYENIKEKVDYLKSLDYHVSNL